MPARGRLTLILFVGITGLAAGYVGELSSPVSESVRLFLDSAGAPLRNVHKLEPLVRLPLVLGLAHLLAKVPLPGSVPLARWRRAFAHPEREPMVALTSLILVALTLSTALAWTGKLAPAVRIRTSPRTGTKQHSGSRTTPPRIGSRTCPGRPGSALRQPGLGPDA
ncbi:hypothetical protein GCM10020255_054640 [Rhodococcus baikonurensis]